MVVTEVSVVRTKCSQCHPQFAPPKSENSPNQNTGYRRARREYSGGMSQPTILLADRLLPVRLSQPLAHHAVAVGAFTLLTALLAQIRIPLAFTPVPITGQTLAVLLAGATLGARRGAISQGLYWLLGMVGFPFYANGTGGWDVATGPTMGYLVGFVVAAAVVGRLAEYRHDRKFITSLSAMCLGSLCIYSCGVAWLAISLDLPISNGESNAIALGVTPFLVGDAIKVCIAGAATSGTWKLFHYRDNAER